MLLYVCSCGAQQIRIVLQVSDTDVARHAQKGAYLACVMTVIYVPVLRFVVWRTAQRAHATLRVQHFRALS